MALTDRPQKVGPPDGSNGQGPLSPAPRPYNWRATVGLIVGIVVVAGAMGVFMRVIPTPFTQPAPTSAPSVRPTAQPAVAPIAPTTEPAPPPAATAFVRNQLATVAPAAQPTAPSGAPATVGLAIGPLTEPTAPPTGAVRIQPATVAPATQATPAPAAVRQPTPAPTGAPTVLPATEPTVEPTTPAAAGAAVDPTLAAEILPAYQHYWEVLDDALATLDDSKLGDAMDGPALLAAQTYVNQLRDQNKAGVGPEDHSITLVTATPEDAVIHDHVVDHSVFVDPATREPLPPDEQGTNTETDYTYYLRNIDGVWKVVGAG